MNHNLTAIETYQFSQNFHTHQDEFRAEIKANHLRNSRYLELMRNGKTSKLQDIDMQRANADAWKKLAGIMEGAK